MPSPIVGSCCCFSLESGGMIVAWIFLTIDSIGIVLSVASLLTKSPVKWCAIFWMIVYCLSWMAYVPWLIGIYSKNTRLMIPALVWSLLYTLIEIVCLGFTIAGVETSFWFSFSNSKIVQKFLPELSIIGAIFNIGLSIFVFIVMYSLYIFMRETIRRRRNTSICPHNNLSV